MSSGIAAFRASQMRSVPRDSGPRVERTMTARPQAEPAGPTVVNFHITTPNAESFRASQGQIMAQTSDAMSRARRRYT